MFADIYNTLEPKSARTRARHAALIVEAQSVASEEAGVCKNEPTPTDVADAAPTSSKRSRPPTPPNSKRGCAPTNVDTDTPVKKSKMGRPRSTYVADEPSDLHRGELLIADNLFAEARKQISVEHVNAKKGHGESGDAKKGPKRSANDPNGSIRTCDFGFTGGLNAHLPLFSKKFLNTQWPMRTKLPVGPHFSVLDNKFLHCFS